MSAVIDAVVRRASAVTSHVRAVSRRQCAHHDVRDFNAAIYDTHKVLRRMIGEEVSIGTSLEPELLAVRMDAR